MAITRDWFVRGPLGGATDADIVDAFIDSDDANTFAREQAKALGLDVTGILPQVKQTDERLARLKTGDRAAWTSLFRDAWPLATSVCLTEGLGDFILAQQTAASVLVGLPDLVARVGSTAELTPLIVAFTRYSLAHESREFHRPYLFQTEIEPRIAYCGIVKLHGPLRDPLSPYANWQRSVLECYFFEGKNVKDISTAYNVPDSNVRRIIVLAKHHLRQIGEEANWLVTLDECPKPGSAR